MNSTKKESIAINALINEINNMTIYKKILTRETRYLYGMEK